MSRFGYMIKYAKPLDEIHWRANFQGKRVYCYFRLNPNHGGKSKSITFGMFDGLMGHPKTKCLVVNTIQYSK